jgi:hypothetical protein
VDYLYDMVPERTKETEMAAQAAKPIERWTDNPRVALVVSTLKGETSVEERVNFIFPFEPSQRFLPDAHRPAGAPLGFDVSLLVHPAIQHMVRYHEFPGQLGHRPVRFPRELYPHRT